MRPFFTFLAAATVAVTAAGLPLTAVAARHGHQAVMFTPVPPSFGQLGGLHGIADPLGLDSSVALVLDEDTNEVLVSKNPQAVLPIASLTKLMTALVVTEANQPGSDILTISQDDVDTEKHSSSRLAVGTQLTRGEMMHLALMASENRAAHALARYFPGGLAACVAAMNRKALDLGMAATRYVEPTGLSSSNQSSAQDLATLVRAAHERQTIRELSTSDNFLVGIGRRLMRFHSTNLLIRNGQWDISLQKTGYITEAGRCMVMRAKMAGHQLVMVLLDATGGRARSDDAERVRKWVLQRYASKPTLAPPTQIALATAATEPPAVSAGTPWMQR